jgi:hypothetical protein
MAMGISTKSPTIIMNFFSNKVGSQVAMGLDGGLSGSFSAKKKSPKVFFLVSDSHKWEIMGWLMS